MNRNILNKIAEEHIQQRIKEKEDKIYAYSLGHTDNIYFIVVDDKDFLYHEIANDLIKKRHNIIASFINQNLYLDEVQKYTQNVRGLDLEKIAEWLENDKDLHNLFAKFIGTIKVTKYL